MEWVNKVTDEIQANQEKINGLKEKKEKEGLNRLETGRLRRAEERQKGMDEVWVGMAQLEESEQVYDVQYDSGLKNGNEENGHAAFDFSNGNAVVYLASKSVNLGTFVHELTHMFQFENGTMSLTPHPNGKGQLKSFLADINDEYKAAEYGNLFGDGSFNQNAPEYKDYHRKPMDVTNHPKILQDLNGATRSDVIMSTYYSIARQAGQAFRTNGKTYYIPKK